VVCGGVGLPVSDGGRTAARFYQFA
jgi:hypothetical protein